MRSRIIALLGAVVVSLSLVGAAFAEEAQMHVLREAVGVKSYPAAPRIAQQSGLDAAVTLAPAVIAVPEELEAIRVWNAADRLPARNGFFRALGDSIKVELGAAVASKSGRHGRGVVTTSSRGVAFGTSIRVEKAARLRAQLENVHLPAGAVLWVYGSSGEPVAFDASTMDEKRSLWTPSVSGETIYIEVEVGSGETASFEINRVLELLNAVKIRAGTDDAPTCLVDADVTCAQNASDFPVIANVSKAIGQIDIITSSGGGVCSGQLITDQAQTSTPYFLTANHCTITTQSVASAIEVFFDYKYLSCVSSQASALPAVRGATLLSTSATSDYTLLRLNSLPAGRVLLGWNSAAVVNGTRLHRISHPVPDGATGPEPQLYSRTIAGNTIGGNCTGAAPPNFVYSNEKNGGEGGVYGGSSGSAIMLDNGQVVGQLLGSCGPDPAAGCDRRNDTMDGAFAQTFDAIKQFIAPTTSGNTPCVPNLAAGQVCLVDNRFEVKVTYNGGSGLKSMTAIKYTGESGLFWFNDAGNIEILLKMINACSFNQRFWVYAGGTTDVEVNISVRDSKNGTIKTYQHVRGKPYGTVTDSSAFATCP
ncbi:MAG: hypothetical protein JJE51_04790 [Thermoanaerobaculia bacterium]|nr:hypothetical protein [Thermoanaerobaculia bacterium]